MTNKPITLDEIIRSAPPPTKGKPTEAEIEELQRFKSKVKAFLITAPQGSDLSYNGIMKKVKARRQGTKLPANEKGDARLKNKSTKTKQTILPMTNREKNGHKQVDYLCILDFEATCQRDGVPNPQEIIEFPTLLVNTKTGCIEDSFHFYIKPDVNPNLSQFCTELTGITQKMVDQGVSLEAALKLHETWLNKHNLVNSDLVRDFVGDKKHFLYVTCGDWDLKTCLPDQLAYHEQSVPDVFDSWINIKRPFQKLYKTRAYGMITMLETLGMRLEGRHHSGIDDCRNIARICARMLTDGWIPKSTGGSTMVGTHQYWKYQLRNPVLESPDQGFKTVLLIRHGHSVGNITRGKDRSNNSSLLDCGLTDEGVQQAKGLAKILGPWAESIQHVISSPLKRALHTALLGFPTTSIQVHYDLGEFGSDIPENRAQPMEETLKDLENEIRSRPDSVRLDFESTEPVGWPNPSYTESHSKRIKTAFKWIYEERSEDVLAVVCHYNVIRTIVQKKDGTVSPENAVPILCHLFPDGRLLPV